MRLMTLLVSVAMVIACGAKEPARATPKANSAVLVTAELPADNGDADPLSFDSLSERHNILLPVDPVRAEVMAPRVSERCRELVEQFKRSISQRPEWWMQYSRDSMPESGGLPYHPNMGLTEAEYAEMGRLLEEMKVESVAQVDLVFLNQGNGKVGIRSADLPQILADIVVDFENDWVETPYGRLEGRDEVNNTDPNAPTGPWSGPRWKLVQPADVDPFGLLAEFALGRRTEDERGVLYYKVRQILPDRQPEKIDLFLLYDRAGE